MRYNTITIITTIILISCSSTKTRTENRCKSIQENDFSIILEEKLELVVNNDTLFLNEVQYECTYTAMITQKGMYDRFGKWDEKRYINEGYLPLLLWNNIKLFPKDTSKFIVIADGLESNETIYASVLVFDNQYNDLLSEKSKYKPKLIEYFAKMIRANNSEKIDFYEAYWKAVNPQRWEQLKQYRKNR